MKLSVKCLSLLLGALIALSACAAPSAVAEETSVLASFYPVYCLAVNLIKDVPGVSLDTLAAPDTGCLHEYQLLPGDMRKLSDADLLLICGAGMEGYLDALTEQLPGLTVLDASEGARLLAEEDEHEADHDEHDEHDDHEDHDEHAYNPHIWLSVPNALVMTANIARGLKALLPEHAAVIDRNLAEYQARLTALDAQLRDGLAALPRRGIVTFHEAFPYFAQEYGLDIVAVVAHEHDASLSPARLAELIETVRAQGNPPLFTEPQYSDMAARTVAAETGAKVYTLDPLVTGDMSPTAYEDGMRANLTALIAALGE